VAVTRDLRGVLAGVGRLDVRDVLLRGEALLDVLDGGAVARIAVLATAPGKTDCINQRVSLLTVKFSDNTRGPYYPEF
jgi:hypothetical protein